MLFTIGQIIIIWRRLLKKIKGITPDLSIDESLIIVASSAKVLEDSKGSVIDGFTDVIRFNRAPIDGYEKFIGSKTTIRVANQHTFGNIPHTGWEIGDQRHDTFIKDQRDVNIVHLGPGLDIWDERSEHVHESCKAFLVDYDGVVATLYPALGHRPSVGFAFLWLCLNSGLKPTIFGYGLDEESYGHYYDENAVSSHPFSIERSIIQERIQSNDVKVL